MANTASRIEIVPLEQDGVSPSKRRHFVRVRGRNGRILAESPVAYTTLTQARRAADALVEAAKQLLNYDALGVVHPPKTPVVVVVNAEKDTNANR